MSGGLRVGLAAAADALEGGQDELTRLDSLQGDGDLGRTAGVIAVAIRESIAEAEGEDASALLSRLGRRISQVAASSSGTLIASAFLGAANALQDYPGTPLQTGMRAGIDAIQRRGKASPGDRTMLDALVPVLTSLDDRPGDLVAAAMSAETGMEATRTMVARVGRARFLAGNAVGEPDPGAVMVGTAIAAALRACS